jgi:peptidoglycan/xylan/chitin deacetylase (PgdA/CDA1 family)
MIGPPSGDTGSCSIVTFHDVGAPRSPIVFPPDLLRAGLLRLAERGYRSLDLLEAAAIVRDGGRFPERSVVLTFDDAFASVHRLALPLLQELGWTATVFVTVGSLGTRSHDSPVADAGEVRELLTAGMSIGAHTLSHPDLARASSAEVAHELRDGKAQLEDLVGASVRSFAYPFGRYDERSRALAEQLYDCACTDLLRRARLGDDPWLLPRIDSWYLGRSGLLGRLDTSLLDGYLTFRRGPRALRRALTT